MRANLWTVMLRITSILLCKNLTGHCCLNPPLEKGDLNTPPLEKGAQGGIFHPRR